MTNDPPSALRMGFGYRQARAAGLGGIRAARSPRQVNIEMSERRIARELRDVVERDPQWGPFVEHWIKEGLKPRDVLQSLRYAEFDAYWRRRGYAKLGPNRYAPF